MCSYKLVTVKFEVWGLQTRVEQFVHKVSETGAVSYPSHKQNSSTHRNVATLWRSLGAWPSLLRALTRSERAGAEPSTSLWYKPDKAWSCSGLRLRKNTSNIFSAVT